MMRKFIVYDNTGQILRTGSCPENMLDIQAHGEGEYILEGEASDETDMVDPVEKILLKNARIIK